MSLGCGAVLVHLAARARGCVALYRIVLSQRHLYEMMSGSLHTILRSFRLYLVVWDAVLEFHLVELYSVALSYCAGYHSVTVLQTTLFHITYLPSSKETKERTPRFIGLTFRIRLGYGRSKGEEEESPVCRTKAEDESVNLKKKPT